MGETVLGAGLCFSVHRLVCKEAPKDVFYEFLKNAPGERREDNKVAKGGNELKKKNHSGDETENALKWEQQVRIALYLLFIVSLLTKSNFEKHSLKLSCKKSLFHDALK